MAEVRAGILVAVEGRPTSTWGDVATDRTGRSWSYHQVSMTFVVGVNFPLTRSRNNATICLSVPVELVNDTGSHSTPQSTRMWQSGHYFTTMKDSQVGIIL